MPPGCSGLDELFDFEEPASEFFYEGGAENRSAVVTRASWSDGNGGRATVYLVRFEDTDSEEIFHDG